MPAGKFTFPYLAYSVFESVLQIVTIALAGFWCAHAGLLPKQSQKIISLLNVDLFTPCLIFSKLAKSLSMAKMLEIFVIPVFFLLMTTISFLSGRILSLILQLDSDETNFVVANSVFSNSNSLPVSLTLSLAYTLPDLTWDQIPNDNRDNVASRGILYLLIFQQMGQMLRWSWGYNTLLRWTGDNPQHMPSSQTESLVASINSSTGINSNDIESNSNDNSIRNCTVTTDTDTDDNHDCTGCDNCNGIKLVKPNKFKTFILKLWKPIHSTFTKFTSYLNPPLYAMIASVIVASITPLQHELFHADGFINNTIAEAVTELGSLSIPLILIILGANLYPSTELAPHTVHHKKLVTGAIVGRIILPSFFLLPIIAITVKYIKVSILDDPIFLVVGFLLTVSPPAIQLTQITQLNEFFEGEMSDVLFWGYVILSLPMTILVVTAAIYVLQEIDA